MIVDKGIFDEKVKGAKSRDLVIILKIAGSQARPLLLEGIVEKFNY